MRSHRLVLVAAAAVVVMSAPAGCSHPVSTSQREAVVAVDEQDLLGPWTDADGQVLPDGTAATNGLLVVATSSGSTTCTADGTVFLQLAWPVGTEVDLFAGTWSEEDAPRFIRDTAGSAMDTVGSSDLDTRLPTSARPTGFNRAGNSISVDPEEVAVYVSRPDGTVEQWARLRGGGCA